MTGLEHLASIFTCAKYKKLSRKEKCGKTSKFYILTNSSCDTKLYIVIFIRFSCVSLCVVSKHKFEFNLEQYNYLLCAQ